MRATTLALSTLALVSSFVSAAPVPDATTEAAILKKRADDIDGTILNYALTLEHLEAAFYKEGLTKFDASTFSDAKYPDWVRYRLTEIANHEATHVSFLTGALKAAGINATAACKYSFPYDSPSTFLAVAQILEGVGTAAYLGAAASITNPDYLTAAGSILTVEARHASWIRSAANNGDGFPTAFDAPLDFNQVYSLAAQFITSCPSGNPALPVKAFPVLTLKTTGALSAGEEIELSYPNSTTGFAVFISGADQYVVDYPSGGKVKIPEGVMGQSYVVITSSNATVSDDITLAGPAVVEVPVQATLFPY